MIIFNKTKHEDIWKIRKHTNQLRTNMNNYEKHMKQLLENIEYIKNILKNTKTKWKNMENK